MTMASMGGLRGGGPQQIRKSKNVRATLRRLLAKLRPERTKLVLALFLGVTSVAFMVSGPEILGRATNVLFDGIVSKQLKPGTTKSQAIQLLRDHGHSQIASI
jgi:ATP-binding cassette subfamily B protein